jgi:hypothetical protein
MKPNPEDYKIYLTSIGSGRYQLFIDNISADSDFIRIIVGTANHNGNTLSGDALFRRIISPLKPECEQVFMHEFSAVFMRTRRVWVIFESLKQRKVQSTFIALSPSASKWRKTIGSRSNLDIQTIDKIEAPHGHIEELIRLSKTGAGSSILIRGAY